VTINPFDNVEEKLLVVTHILWYTLNQFFVGLTVFEQIIANLFERPIDLRVVTYFWTDTNQTSVRMEHSYPTGRTFMESDIYAFFENPLRKFNFN
jgi:hypothetical protein